MQTCGFARTRPGEGPISTCAVTRRRFSSGCKPHPATAPAGSDRSRHGGDEVSESLRIAVTTYGDRASVQAATRVNAEQASHDEGLVKGSHHGNIETSPVASVSKVQAHLRDPARFRARSTSHAVAAHSSCTKIPLSAGRAQEDENHSRKRHFRPWLATVRLPGSART